MLLEQMARGQKGRRARGEWRPDSNGKLPPIYGRPFQPLAGLNRLFLYDGYLLPWNVFYIGLATGLWFWLCPPLEQTASMELGEMVQIFARN